jgi:DNA-binding Lrp family transcriptional regulator
MKNVELKLISELMKNSRRSYRELAKAVGVSQPTVSRTLKKLEKEGYIKEYTMIPDFLKLGYQIMGVTLIKRSEPADKDKCAERYRQALACSAATTEEEVQIPENSMLTRS